eukprot:COSAG06_NODE_1625_length_8891_cov_55.617379_2_plen_156_part_00
MKRCSEFSAEIRIGLNRAVFSRRRFQLKNVIEIQIEPRLRKAKGATSPFQSNSRILDRKPLDGVGTAGRAGDRCWQSLQSSRNKTQQQQQRQQRQQQQQQVPEIKSSSPPPPPQRAIAERNGLSLCVSRACLGRMIVFMYKWLQNAAYLPVGRRS